MVDVLNCDWGFGGLRFIGGIRDRLRVGGVYFYYFVLRRVWIYIVNVGFGMSVRGWGGIKFKCMKNSCGFVLSSILGYSLLRRVGKDLG